MWLVCRIRELADEEALQSGSTIAFMQNIVPAVPVLLLGFICMEGKELVSATTGQVTSSALYRTGQVTGLFHDDHKTVTWLLQHRPPLLPIQSQAHPD